MDAWLDVWMFHIPEEVVVIQNWQHHVQLKTKLYENQTYGVLHIQ